MALSTLTMNLSPFVQLLAFSTNLPVPTLLSKMVFQRESTDIQQKLVLHFYTSLIFLSIIGPMLSLLQRTLSIEYLLLFQVFTHLGRKFIQNHYLFMLLKHLVVPVIHTLGLLTNISCNLDLNLVFFLAILHSLKVISALILLLTESTLPVMFCLMSLSSLLLMILASLILIFLSPHLSLIGYLNPHKLLISLFLLHLLNLLLSLHLLTSHLLFFLLFFLHQLLFLLFLHLWLFQLLFLLPYIFLLLFLLHLILKLFLLCLTLLPLFPFPLILILCSQGHSMVSISLELWSHSFTIAFKHPQWVAAIDAEFQSLKKQATWSLVPLPPHKNVVTCKWVYKLKRHIDGSIARYKARLVARGYLQQYGMDYDETFSPVVKPVTVRILLSLVVQFGWELRQLDVSNAFLHGVLKEEVYIAHPQGYVDSAFPNHVCLLHMALYGLKQAPRAWFERFTSQLLHIGFCASATNGNLFILRHGSSIVFLLLYVDDIIITGNKSSFVSSISNYWGWILISKILAYFITSLAYKLITLLLGYLVIRPNMPLISLQSLV